MTVGPGSRIAITAALTLAVSAAVIGAAPVGAAAGSCGASLGDYRGEFVAAEDPSNVLSFDGAGGIAFRSSRFGIGEGIYTVIPTGGFSATLRLTDSGEDVARPGNERAMVKSTAFVCPTPGPTVGNFSSLDQSGRRFNYVRSS
ncbi:hypothetical protein ACWDUL_23765 [Nocardia niigatensis]|uniref:hypothetical protein n=1 Tax=Nocardia niigatensis TaxID=209249 RepID=UPI00031CC2B9|nr:hypothetical protein [Nocardia niigatensis]